MDWVLDNLQVLFLVAIAVVAILQRLKKARDGEETGRTTPGTSEEEENTRRIQEEIRRRIMERRGLSQPAPQSGGNREESRAFPPAPPRIEEIRPIRIEPPPATAAWIDRDEEAEFKRQQEMIERARALEAARISRSAAVAKAPVAAAAAETGGRLLPELQGRSALRRSILVREILGPPVGLR